MFAVIKTGGKQYSVAANDELEVELLEGAPGDMITFGEILLVGGEAGITIGAPFVEGATVAAEIIDQMRTRKILVFKKRRRQNSKRSRGHRQHLTIVRITEILTNGAQASGKKATKAKVAKAAAPATDAAPAALVSGGLDSSNLSLISGIGPTIEKKLRAAGVTSWEQIAAWTDADIAKYDEELTLRGRVGREEWVQQASELLAGKPPRAKIDQAELKSGEDR
ncbi:50S ribosomal protein L21 [Kaistia terrae]|jgi:large subunit ribosomal protein L21|uniref:Large ribosomal subunit protein bL21 n=1 Tax=Kaistia terrae TaxID=537017 RepID=A0ABW0PZN7_9HYPH|nr:50S ribosomal protein L21 [Kaistia terrae]MCX5580964.1 50S ribosomal protein L21 [Kaistia terrae]